ncbi:nuclear pore complex protein Nup155 isoform X2 [Hyalella azteca]|nr:nuclear pore complex protein Nup155 isoform X2 [Hyalella azteca]XP_047737712.1 nuclear pore complex protein Nup155 isoform X2 [Hyalella azteca]XP_047737713.1 nuclear pore complex protein Nup155 isoform X2 [Hyalella azteca]
MLENTLNSSIMAGQQEEAADLDTAGRMLEKHIAYDSCFPALTDKLQIMPKGGVTVSGLSESDYPCGSGSSSSNAALRHLHTMRKVPLPKELLHHFQHMQCNCMMGLFPEIGRAWLTIDSAIYVWMYKDGSDLAYFDGLQDTILAVALIKPKPGVFKPYIEHLLVLTTPSELLLLGVTFSQALEDDSTSCLTLLPEPLFSVANDGVVLATVTATSTGRLFMGGRDGALWELLYQAEEGWFSRKCQKVNHSRSALASLLPSFLTLSEQDCLIQIDVDESRCCLFTLSERGSISLYDIEGGACTRVATLTHATIMTAASAAARTVDKANFKSIVSICALTASEASWLHLLAFTSCGVRLYFTATAAASPASARPHHLQLVHVRLPPGFSANSLTHRPTRVHKALYSNGCSVLCASEAPDSDVLWSVSPEQFPQHATLAESAAVLAVDGVIWAIADVTPTSRWCATSSEPRSPLVVTQLHQPPRELVVLSAAGAHLLTCLRPVDQLRHLLQDGRGADSVLVKEFFSALGSTQACSVALLLATDPSPAATQVAQAATQCLFRYGSAAPAALAASSQLHQSYSFHPTQMSTPAGVQQQQGSASDSRAVATQQSTEDSSALHTSLYLHLARILRPVWAAPLLPTDPSTQLSESSLSSEECVYLARHVELLARFIGNPPDGTPSQPPPPTSGSHTNGGLVARCSSGDEARSIAAVLQLLRHLLQLLRLWALLTNNQLPAIISQLPTAEQEQLRGLTLRDLALSGSSVCRALVMALLDRYHGDEASVSTISRQLRSSCPSLYRAEDAQLSAASQLILSARTAASPADRDAAFAQAVTLCKGVGGCVNVAGVAAQLAGGGCYTGLVDLALSVAAQRDEEGRALLFYKAGRPSHDTKGHAAFTTRMECYRVIMEHLAQLMGSSSGSGGQELSSPASVPRRPGPPAPPCAPPHEASSQAQQMMEMVCRSGDELAQVSLIQWLLDSGRTDQVLALQCPALEGFLKAPPTPRLDLLWRLYERNKEYYNAARTLALLADQPGSTCLRERVEQLSRALMCLSACEMNTATAFTDFLLHLEEKKEVARVQLMVLEGVRAAGADETTMQRLDSSLLDITTLYEQFAEPYGLWRCKLAIVACAGHSEPQLVQSLWSHIIDEELQQSQGAPVSERLDRLAASLKALAHLYSSSPSYFPLEHIIRLCEVQSVRLKAASEGCVGWLVSALLSCGVTISRLLTTYHTLYRSGESVWETEREPHHLLRVMAYLFNHLLECPPASLTPHDRRLLKELSLDRLASYLTDLDASAEPSAGLLAAHLRTCQVQLERSFA